MSNKPIEEITYDIITDIYRAAHGQPSITKLEQLKRVGVNMAQAINKVSERACVDVFERLQKRVHNAFVAMEGDLKKLEEKVEEKLKSTEDRNKNIETQIESVKDIANRVRAEIKSLDSWVKGIGQ